MQHGEINYDTLLNYMVRVRIRKHMRIQVHFLNSTILVSAVQVAVPHAPSKYKHIHTH